ncbi:MAG: hypothetical protein LBQ12_14525 [Deltaproteobacteria bacterium]|jgi:hypothetical protein|nr:hypothetical protein [Deltaproteobacteria bacterium]
MAVTYADQLRLPGPPRTEAEVPRREDVRPWILTKAQLAANEYPPSSGIYPALASRPWVLVTDQDPEESAAVGESWGTPGVVIDTGGKWIDGKTVWKCTFWAGPFTPGLTGSIVGHLPGIDTVVKTDGMAFVAGKGAVEVNGSGFSAVVLPNGDVKVYGPEGETAAYLHFTVRFTLV